MSSADLVSFVRTRLAALADTERAAKTQRYLKTDMPMFGVDSKTLKGISREAHAAFIPADRDGWEDNVLALWSEPERELKYAAIGYARAFKRSGFLQPASLPLAERMIREGAWWDLVDDLAANVLGGILLRHRDERRSTLEAYIADPDLWIRRSAVLAQLAHREHTDVELLLALCRAAAPERSFWMRKAIGWALRQHARTDADVVRAFLGEMGESLSGLSRREASRHLD